MYNSETSSVTLLQQKLSRAEYLVEAIMLPPSSKSQSGYRCNGCK